MTADGVLRDEHDRAVVIAVPCGRVRTADGQQGVMAAATRRLIARSLLLTPRRFSYAR
jgi:hypothetical protein